MTTTRSAILILPRTQKFAGGKISGFERKSFTRQNSPDSKVFGFKVPTLNSGKISGDELNDHLQTHARGCSSVGRPIKGQGTPNHRGSPQVQQCYNNHQTGEFLFRIRPLVCKRQNQSGTTYIHTYIYFLLRQVGLRQPKGWWGPARNLNK